MIAAFSLISQERIYFYSLILSQYSSSFLFMYCFNSSIFALYSSTSQFLAVLGNSFLLFEIVLSKASKSPSTTLASSFPSQVLGTYLWHLLRFLSEVIWTPLISDKFKLGSVSMMKLDMVSRSFSSRPRVYLKEISEFLIQF